MLLSLSSNLVFLKKESFEKLYKPQTFVSVMLKKLIISLAPSLPHTLTPRPHK